MVRVVSVPLGSFPHNFQTFKGEDGKTIRLPLDGEGVKRKALASFMAWLRSPSKRFDGTFEYSDKKVYLWQFAPMASYKDGPFERPCAEYDTLATACENGLVDVTEDDRIILTHKGKTWDYTFKD